HTDITFSPTPPKASIFHMRQPAASGGDTMFSNQYLAYEMLSDPLRAMLDGLTAIHTGAAFGHPEITVEHPLVRIHPETGRPCLFVNRGYTGYIPQLRPAESDVLLEHLYRWSELPGFQCRYTWAEGDVGVWDNRCTQHFAVADYVGRRVAHRVTVI